MNFRTVGIATTLVLAVLLFGGLFNLFSRPQKSLRNDITTHIKEGEHLRAITVRPLNEAKLIDWLRAGKAQITAALDTGASLVSIIVPWLPMLLLIGLIFWCSRRKLEPTP